MNVTMLLAIGVALAGLASVAAGVSRRRLAGDPAAYLHDLELDAMSEVEGDSYSHRMRLPFLSRVMRPLGSGFLERVASLTPRNYAGKVHRQLLQAGLSGSVRAEEFITGQAVATGAGILAAALALTMLELSTSKATLVLVLGPSIGALFPARWLSRKVQERKDAILNDLPDVVDLLAISVEAGVGFEGGLEIVCSHFECPLSEELSRTLKEMELGLPRREALHNLRKRTEVADLNNFVMALTQADALGMPIGRILHTQAKEMRNKRRQRAREKAAKLPVKILFPLVAFIFPAVLIVILGPAMASVAESL